MTKFSDFSKTTQLEIVNEAVMQIITHVEACPYPPNSIPFVIMGHLMNVIIPIVFFFTYGYLLFNDHEFATPAPANDTDLLTTSYAPEPSPFTLELPPPPEEVAALRDISNKENIETMN
jgi:hypothetical protein